MSAIKQATDALSHIAAIASYAPMQEGTQTAGEMGRVLAIAEGAIAMLAAAPAAPAPVPPAFVDEWEHGCDALLTNIKLWTARCPHCGKPAPEASKGGAA